MLEPTSNASTRLNRICLVLITNFLTTQWIELEIVTLLIRQIEESVGKQ